MANHPHIVEMKGAFLTPYYLALVMEYVEGETVEVGYGYQGGSERPVERRESDVEGSKLESMGPAMSVEPQWQNCC